MKFGRNKNSGAKRFKLSDYVTEPPVQPSASENPPESKLSVEEQAREIRRLEAELYAANNVIAAQTETIAQLSDAITTMRTGKQPPADIMNWINGKKNLEMNWINGKKNLEANMAEIKRIMADPKLRITNSKSPDHIPADGFIYVTAVERPGVTTLAEAFPELAEQIKNIPNERISDHGAAFEIPATRIGSQEEIMNNPDALIPEPIDAAGNEVSTEQVTVDLDVAGNKIHLDPVATQQYLDSTLPEEEKFYALVDQQFNLPAGASRNKAKSMLDPRTRPVQSAIVIQAQRRVDSRKNAILSRAGLEGRFIDGVFYSPLDAIKIETEAKNMNSAPEQLQLPTDETLIPEHTRYPEQAAGTAVSAEHKDKAQWCKEHRQYEWQRGWHEQTVTIQLPVQEPEETPLQRAEHMVATIEELAKKRFDRRITKWQHEPYRERDWISFEEYQALMDARAFIRNYPESNKADAEEQGVTGVDFFIAQTPGIYSADHPQAAEAAKKAAVKQGVEGINSFIAQSAENIRTIANKGPESQTDEKAPNSPNTRVNINIAQQNTSEQPSAVTFARARTAEQLNAPQRHDRGE